MTGELRKTAVSLHAAATTTNTRVICHTLHGCDCMPSATKPAAKQHLVSPQQSKRSMTRNAAAARCKSTCNDPKAVPTIPAPVAACCSSKTLNFDNPSARTQTTVLSQLHMMQATGKAHNAAQCGCTHTASCTQAMII